MRWVSEVVSVGKKTTVDVIGLACLVAGVRRGRVGNEVCDVLGSLDAPKRNGATARALTAPTGPPSSFEVSRSISSHVGVSTMSGQTQ